MAVTQNAPVQGRVSKIYDHLYANAPVKTPSAIAYEFGKIAHACLFIEQENGGAPAFPCSPKEQKQIERGDTVLIPEIASRVKTAFSRMCSSWKLYQDDPSIGVNDFDVAYTASLIGDLQLSDPRSDLIGDIFEIIRSQFAKEKGGQFFTDPQVTHLAMKLLQFDPLGGDDLVDICAGTGGFLLAGMSHLEERVKGETSLSASDIITKAFHGLEIDPEASRAANGTIRARFGNQVGEVVATRDALNITADESENKVSFGKHLCVATNPPFGTKITVKDPMVLQMFELARFSKRGVSTSKLHPQAPDTLFLEQNLKLLVPEIGRLAIVVPYQLLSGPQASRIRQWLICNATIRAVIDLPADTFQPHTGTKGALLVVSRRAEPLQELSQAAGETIFMSAPEHVGHDRRGHAIYLREPDGRLSSEILTDFPEVASAYESYLKKEDPKKAHSNSFVTIMGDVLASPLMNLNASYHLRSAGADFVPKNNNIKFQPLGELVREIFFPGRFKRNYVPASHPGAVPFMGGAGITEFIETGRKWISPDDPNLSKLAVRSGWLLVTRSGTTGIVSTVPSSWDGYALSEHVIRIIPKPEMVDAGYLYAVLSSAYGQAYLRRGVFGSVIDEISPEYLAALPVPLPNETMTIQKIGEAMMKAECERASAMEVFRRSVSAVNELFTP